MADTSGRDALDTNNQLAITEQPINKVDLDMIFLHIMRCPGLFAEARNMIRPEFFHRDTEPEYGLLWAAIIELHGNYGQFNYETITYNITNRLIASPDILSAEVKLELLQDSKEGIVKSIMDMDERQLMPNLGRDTLRRFLRERMVYAPLARIAGHGGGARHVADMAEVINAAHRRLQHIDTLREIPMAGRMPVRGAAPPADQIYIPTTLDFFDSYIRGQRPGDCNGILGNFGSGKTTLGVHLAVVNAENCHGTWLRNRREGRREISVFVSYEEPEDKIMRRIWTCACQIQKDTIEALRWENLSTPGNLKPYEIRLFGNKPGQIVKSESERWDETATWLDDSLVMLDMSGSERFPNAGSGSVSEIVASLERLVLDQQVSIRSVVIDYAGLMCKRYMEANNISDDKLRLQLAKLGEQLRRQVSVQFRCTTWLLHQFNGEQGKRSPTALMHHTDAAESKAFAENLAACLCLGVMDQTTGCLLANWSKVRYFADRSKAPAVLQIDGELARMINVSNRYQPDAITRTFIDPQVQASVQGRTNPVSNGPSGLRRRASVSEAQL